MVVTALTTKEPSAVLNPRVPKGPPSCNTECEEVKQAHTMDKMWIRKQKSNSATAQEHEKALLLTLKQKAEAGL